MTDAEKDQRLALDAILLARARDILTGIAGTCYENSHGDVQAPSSFTLQTWARQGLQHLAELERKG